MRRRARARSSRQTHFAELAGMRRFFSLSLLSIVITMAVLVTVMSVADWRLTPRLIYGLPPIFSMAGRFNVIHSFPLSFSLAAASAVLPRSASPYRWTISANFFSSHEREITGYGADTAWELSASILIILRRSLLADERCGACILRRSFVQFIFRSRYHR